MVRFENLGLKLLKWGTRACWLLERRVFVDAALLALGWTNWIGTKIWFDERAAQ